MAGEKQYSFQTGTYSKFSTVDYVLFGLILVVSAAIGFYFAIKDRRRNNTKTFLMAGGNMNPIPVALSLLASFMSAITLLGTPAEMYNYTIGLSYFFVAAHVFMPVFYRLHVTSAYKQRVHWQSNEINDLEDQLNMTQTENEQLQGELFGKDQQICHLEATIEMRNGTIDDLYEEIERLRQFQNNGPYNQGNNGHWNNHGHGHYYQGNNMQWNNYGNGHYNFYQ